MASRPEPGRHVWVTLPNMLTRLSASEHATPVLQLNSIMHRPSGCVALGVLRVLAVQQRVAPVVPTGAASADRGIRRGDQSGERFAMECFQSLRDTGWDNPCYPVTHRTAVAVSKPRAPPTGGMASRLEPGRHVWVTLTNMLTRLSA